MGRVMTKYLFALTIPDKIFGTNYKIPAILDRKKSLISAFACFLTAIANVSFMGGGGGGVGADWPLGYVSSQL